MASASDPGRPVEILVREAVGDTVEFTVRDHGPGVSPDDLPRLFEPFYSTRPGAMGMGLTVSRTIVEATGGCLSCWAPPDGGTELRVRLPAAIDAPRPTR